VCFVRVW